MLEKLKQKLREKKRQLGAAGVAALAIGGIASALGVDLAPGQIDALVTAGGVLLYALREIRSSKGSDKNVN